MLRNNKRRTKKPYEFKIDYSSPAWKLRLSELFLAIVIFSCLGLSLGWIYTQLSGQHQVYKPSPKPIQPAILHRTSV